MIPLLWYISLVKLLAEKLSHHFGSNLGCSNEKSLTQRTLTIGASITVWLVSRFTRLHSSVSLHIKNIIFCFLGHVQSCETEDHRFSDPSPNSECSLSYFMRGSISDIFRLVKCKPVKQEVSCMVILHPSK